ncbi:MAG: NAD(P)H-quinone oxidoreductase [Microbacteriaceae bacterium]
MRAITIPTFGGPEVLTLAELPDPVPDYGEVLISVAAAGVNRSDILQRKGSYPPPAGAPDWPGLEVSGTVSGLGAGVTGWSIGDRVCALLGGGGYASLAVAPVGQLLPVPETLDIVDAAGLPEAVATVWSNVFMLAGLREGETLLVHGGSSGIGTMAIQLARARGCRVAVTASTPEKLAACRALGADILVNYREEDFVERVLADTDGRGADVILDPIGGDYFGRNLAVLALRGRIVLIANQSGTRGELNVRVLMGKWASVYGTTLRARPIEEKDEIMADLLAKAWPLVESGRVAAVIDSRIPLADARLAHERLESSGHIGKVLLIPER